MIGMIRIRNWQKNFFAKSFSNTVKFKKILFVKDSSDL